MEGRERFRFRSTGIGRLVSGAGGGGAGPWGSWIDVSPTTVDVRMGWVFHAAIPRSAIVSASEYPERVPVTIGVHGSGGRWTVNTASTGLVEIALDPPVRARAWWVANVALSRLVVSVEDPQRLVAAITPPVVGTSQVIE